MRLLLFAFAVVAALSIGATLALQANLGSNTSASEPIEGVDVSLSPAPKQAPSGALDARLQRLVDVLRAYGSGGLDAIAREARIPLEGQAVRVVAETVAEDTSEFAAQAAALGARIETRRGGSLQISAPVELLETLASDTSVERIRLPLRPVPASEVTGKGVEILRASDWHDAGFAGAGVRVAVLDLGFAGYDTLLGSELPPAVTTHSCRADADITANGETHGTAVAEIVHEMAPDATLFLANFNTDLELADCVDWLAGQGVQIINFSIGYFGSGPGDGTGVINEIVDGAKDSGILWANAAGNFALAHWMGQWSDQDADEVLNVDGIDETIHIDARAGELIDVVLKWDDGFGTSCNDYDLFLLDPTTELTVASSEGYQGFCADGVPAFPVEALSFEVPATGRYHIAVTRFDATGDATFHLYSFGHDCPIMERCVAAESLAEPADNRDVLSIGAVPWNDPEHEEPYSSQGPTADGRTKPDLVAPDGVSNVSWGAFYGTSASVAHVSGAAALVQQWKPEWSNAEIGTFLASRSDDLGPRGPDNVFGAGRVDLGLPKPTPTPTATATATPTDTPTATPTSTPSPTPRGRAGDVDCDGRVTSLDAALVLQYHAGLARLLACEHNADVDSSGRIDALDAMSILVLVADVLR